MLRSGRLTEKAHLTTGTMIHRLCKAPKSNCLTEPRVVRALEVFEDKLGVNCRTTNPEQKQDVSFGIFYQHLFSQDDSSSLIGATITLVFVFRSFLPCVHWAMLVGHRPSTYWLPALAIHIAKSSNGSQNVY